MTATARFHPHVLWSLFFPALISGGLRWRVTLIFLIHILGVTLKPLVTKLSRIRISRSFRSGGGPLRSCPVCALISVCVLVVFSGAASQLRCLLTSVVEVPLVLLQLWVPWLVWSQSVYRLREL